MLKSQCLSSVVSGLCKVPKQGSFENFCTSLVWLLPCRNGNGLGPIWTVGCCQPNPPHTRTHRHTHVHTHTYTHTGTHRHTQAQRDRQTERERDREREREIDTSIHIAVNRQLTAKRRLVKKSVESLPSLQFGRDL